MKLHGFFRSSAAQRVRIALNLKGIKVDQVSHHLPKGEHKTAGYVAVNPQGLVPSLELDDGTILTQSLAIIEWLNETHPQPPLLPADPIARAKVRAFALVIACEIHPLQSLGMLNRLRKLSLPEDVVKQWAITSNLNGLEACEKLIADVKGPFCFGSTPSLSDVFLVPQLGNARRNGADVSGFRRLMEAEAACLKIDAFAAAEPDKQPDAA
jgi:maleylacetoacetate isomerase